MPVSLVLSRDPFLQGALVKLGTRLMCYVSVLCGENNVSGALTSSQILNKVITVFAALCGEVHELKQKVRSN